MLIWYAVRCKTQREIWSEARLRDHGYQTYLPRTQRPRAGRQGADTIPLFPGYFFLHTDHPSLSAFVRGWDYMQILDRPVPDDAIEELHGRESAGIIALPKTRTFDPLIAGVAVEVVGYGMAGFFGQRGLCQGMTGDQRIAVLFEMLGRPQVLTFERGDLRALAYT